MARPMTFHLLTDECYPRSLAIGLTAMLMTKEPESPVSGRGQKRVAEKPWKEPLVPNSYLKCRCSRLPENTFGSEV